MTIYVIQYGYQKDHIYQINWNNHMALFDWNFETFPKNKTLKCDFFLFNFGKIALGFHFSYPLFYFLECGLTSYQRQGAIKYGRLAAFLPGNPDFHRKFGLFWTKLNNNHKENPIRFTECISFSQEILISCSALPGSRKNYSGLPMILFYYRNHVNINYLY